MQAYLKGAKPNSQTTYRLQVMMMAASQRFSTSAGFKPI